MFALQRLRRLMFSDKFYVLYGGGGFEGVMMGSGVGRPEFKAWENKVHPRVPDPDDRRGDQLRRGQVCYSTTFVIQIG